MFNEIFIGKCPACGGASTINTPLCDKCLILLQPFVYFCGKCGFPLVKVGSSCYRCKGKISKRINNIYAMYHYNKSIRGLILNLKFHYNIRLKWTLNKLFYLPQLFTLYDGVIAVPSHFFRHFFRFYHPTDLLTSWVATQLNIPVLNNLKRIHYTKFQSHILRKERKENVKNAFYCKKFTSDTKNILLVDDILTTGATINECVQVLHKAGARKIDVLVFAK